MAISYTPHEQKIAILSMAIYPNSSKQVLCDKSLFQSTKAALILGGETSSVLGCGSGGAAPVFVARWQEKTSFLARGLTGSCTVLQPALFCNIISSTNHEMAFKGKAVESKVRGQLPCHYLADCLPDQASLGSVNQNRLQGYHVR